MRTIHLPALDRSVSLRAYIAAVKLAKAHPEAVFRHGLTCWWPCTGAQIVKQFQQGVMDRINQSIPYTQRGLQNNH